MDFAQIGILAIIQGAAELLPVSSSAHVIVAEKLMGLDPSAPEMTFLLVMLHTGTMFAVLLFFWNRWKKLNFEFLKGTFIATAVTGVLGLSLKFLIERGILEGILGHPHGEVESLFKSLPLIALALSSVGILILYSSKQEVKIAKKIQEVSLHNSIVIGMVQGLCLPFRGFSRSGATISTGLIRGIDKGLAEDFSFALALWVTPPVIVLELHRLLKASGINLLKGEAWEPEKLSSIFGMILPGLGGMVLAFLSGWFALKVLSKALENQRWGFFGYYCLGFAAVVLVVHFGLL